ncbi:ATP-binding protein [Granulicoccus sp. GXG6511]|uniref:GAF domain-containing sensor histidine kinase n=1 Tax=Granulicoccus sp. GXG6511 TaxID=3381351 RepID=UPI003D7EA14A
MTDQTLLAVLDASIDAMLLLDRDGRCTHANAAAAATLGRPEQALIGTRPLADWRPAFAEDSGRPVLRRHEFGIDRTLQIRRSDVGERQVVVLRDVTDAERSQRRLAAFARAASRVAYADSLRETLDAICAEMIRTVELAAAQILLIDTDTWRMQLHGAAPVAYFGPDFSDRILQAAALGAEFSSLASLRTGQPIVTPDRRRLMLADPRWAPLHDHLTGFEWGTFVSVPLAGRDAPIGALNIYCRPGRQPTFDDVAFFTAMADQVSVAVQHARLFAASRSRTQHLERQRLAQELHDSACQELFSINLHVRAAKFLLDRVRPGQPDEVAGDAAEAVGKLERHVATLGELAHAALEDMRSLIFELYPTVLHDEGLVAVARQLVASLSAREGIDGSVVCPEDGMTVAGDAVLEAYHIIREALHNVIKHAQADRVTVTLQPDPEDAATLVIEVADDGVGMSAGPRRGLGLTSMRERAERVGGSLHLGPATGGGTLVRAVLPGALAVGIPDRDRSGRVEGT